MEFIENYLSYMLFLAVLFIVTRIIASILGLKLKKHIITNSIIKAYHYIKKEEQKEMEKEKEEGQ